MDNSKYVEYVNSHVDEIVEYVNECLERLKEFIKVKMIRRIRDELSPIPVHYEMEFDYNPYDNSGILVEDGYISLDQTVEEFLENEYSGNKIATYERGRGWDYYTYEDEIRSDILTIIGDIMFPAIRRYIENHFGVNLSDDEFYDIQSECFEFDDIYTNSKASDFFDSVATAEFVGIQDMQLKDIVKNGRNSNSTT